MPGVAKLSHNEGMRSRLPPLIAVRAFEAAARLGSFARAAEELSITPAAVSQQVRYLEQRLEVRLFTRQARAVRLTEAGRRFLGPARRALAEGDRAVEAARDP